MGAGGGKRGRYMCKLKNETRELIIGMINEGLTNAQIAEKLDVSA